ncbi:Cytosolic Fe-S cluster assembly factor CFD1 [Neolecta irregularis DAH-3]|uniref:Cytosolic Fe-S cluster assembly factor CFD1 n=1 Tax=Neolecta irregularis (strain DAH-3) TaxID=1198029 RepID=A0A1U7LUX0_NEOID|nr:Cytosolic Fe-S cluster assembly factor CFD1 [Neolecta irregularis DAH-3]|eukprot:OLL26342.1 Cytosolic Fe-S cluster assembly factor CFD1 [Neolecta irregularis DAH-3]
MSLKDVSHIVLILSGKGGVGKSSIALQLALSLVICGKKVGILDIDLTGPSIPRMLGLESRQVHQSSAGWIPVYLDDSKKLCAMSIGFLSRNRGDSVVWRGPKKTAMIKQFMTDVAWGQLDYLLIDTPPGTSDEHISMAEQLTDLKPDGAILVTTPQAIATADVRKELNFCHKVGLNVLGVIENMSGFICPHCSECTNIFSTGGGEILAVENNVPFLGRLPIDPAFITMTEQQHMKSNKNDSLVSIYQKSASFDAFRSVTEKILIGTV